MTRNNKNSKTTKKSMNGEFIRVPVFKMSPELRDCVAKMSKAKGISAGAAFLEIALSTFKGK